MLITTGNDLPGHQIEEIYGEVFGLTVRSRNVGSQIGASFKSCARPSGPPASAATRPRRG